jgi:hypothetical protein
LVHFLKNNFPFPVKLRFPSNFDNCKSKCCSQICCKKYYWVFLIFMWEIIMSIMTADCVDMQTLIDRQSRNILHAQTKLSKRKDLGLTVVYETKRNETKRNLQFAKSAVCEICNLRNLQFAKSVICEICSLRNL